ncbi:hypothetical protein ACTXI0_14225 [Arthrobacter rhombi]|uniref:hypothetical protein n=1 Tax=Arthrobacter rhombi TaxID=71253 RepID=UPI003FD03F87
MTADDDVLRKEIHALADLWFGQSGPEVDPELHDVDAFLNCVGYATAAAECALSYLDADPDNRVPLGIIARSLFEIGITCVWLSLTGARGYGALAYENHRQKRALAKEFRAASGPLGRSAREVLDEDPLVKPELMDQARFIERRMVDLDSGDTPLYAIYRLYSKYAHASLDLSDSYLEKDERGGLSIRIPGKHKALNEDLGTALAPFVWAVNAVNKMHGSRPFTAQLEKLQGLLGTGIDFELKPGS